MKINNQYTNYCDNYNSQKNNDVNEKNKKVTKEESVAINLSNASKQIRLSDQVVDSDNSKRVAEIKKAINDGSYKVSSDKLADKLFETIKGQQQ